ncbi:D-glycero-alpha-D-manno-heptose-1,7-bisphosphate 7-phosphatase [Janibacter alittae]|uniref:D,D-heptose 1,7-bisphosphate phosphatase n=1 Tax=Janibacter alittae TaxID=3115209 RepID=A0ABZ2MDD9_9MICO
MIDSAGPGAPFDLVLLDRDGTLNVRVPDGYVTRPEDLVMLPGAGRAVGRIAATGCRIVLVTNQRGIARGRMTGADLVAVHARLREEVALGGGRLDGIAVCPHEEGECRCRKPQDGLFRAALSRAPWASADRCLMIGDMPSDLEPAARLGMRTLRVDGSVGIVEVLDRVLGSDPVDDRPS